MANPERPWLQLAVPDAPDPLDPGGESLADVNDDDETDDDDTPFYVESQADYERWQVCEELAEKMTNDDPEQGPLVARSLYLSDIPTDENDLGRVAVGNEPPSSEVPAGIED